MKEKVIKYEAFGIFHPKGYLRCFEDNGRYQVYISKDRAYEQLEKRPDCKIKKVVISVLE